MSTPAFSPILVTRQTCRLCGSRELTPVVSLGDQYIGGTFAKSDSTPPVQRRIPLDLVRCDPALDQNACGLVQMRHSVPPRVLYASYWYRSGVNQTMRDNLAGIAHMAEEIAQLEAGDLVLDIGCNDGTLLKSYRTKDIKRLGIDPSNVVSHARAAGLQVVNDFFSAAALHSVHPHQKPKVITSIAMFYDLENPHAFVGDIKSSLHEEGVWILELSYLPTMLAMNSFDTICHEHLEYYSLAPMERLLAEHGLEVIDVTLNDVNGGSFRIAAGHAGKMKPSDEARDRVQQLRLREFELALDTDAPFAVFRKILKPFARTSGRFLKKPGHRKSSFTVMAPPPRATPRCNIAGSLLTFYRPLPTATKTSGEPKPSAPIFRSSPKKRPGSKNRITISPCPGTSLRNFRSANGIFSDAAGGLCCPCRGFIWLANNRHEARGHHRDCGTGRNLPG